MQRFLDRHEAGQRLALKLKAFENRSNVVVLGLPRGGVPVAYEVAKAIDAPMDILIVRKLGLPGHEELAIGAIASGGIRILNEDIVDTLAIPEAIINHVTEREQLELQRREGQYRRNRPPLEVRGRIVILIDDGLATGASMLAAVRAVDSRQPAQVLVAVPAASIQAIHMLQREVDQVIYALAPEPFEGVGKWYEDFSQTTDQEVQLLLEEANRDFQNNAR